MCESESDSGVLSFFDVDRFFSFNYGGSSELELGIICPQSTYDTVYSNTNNAEDITHTLQEELSGLSITGASEQHTGEYQQSTNAQYWPHIEYPQSPFSVQPWHIQPGNYYAGTFFLSVSSYAFFVSLHYGCEQLYKILRQ